MSPPIRIGIDLGGTKIEAVALGLAGEELLRRRIPTPAGDAAATLAAIAALVNDLETELGAAATVGVATPGAPSPRTGLLRNSNSICLNGLPIETLLAEILGRPVRIANDANCFALSEARDGAGAGSRVVFGVILGTGVGGGVVVDGALLTGPHGIAGEWGHNPLPWPRDDERPGDPCYCGCRGCIETFLSGPGLARDHFRHSGQDLSALEIADSASRGDRDCVASLERYAERLARALATIINVLDPDAIVLGGGLSNVASLYAAVPDLWGRFVFSDVVETRLLPPRHGDSSGVRGAAWLWGEPTQK